ncbi:MAG: NifB/NifX family molybdenum-iron cluster-binding protein [Sulfurospirillaceae bacterium]|nr:NifB/NifX family molybdenum-iron cluster-binding protein [Sulfurospirillaceae bacterium]
MIAIPVKTDKEEGVLAPLFGHAKYFSFISDDGSVMTHKNSAEGGVKVVDWLVSMGVKTIILNHVGEKPFHLLTQKSIDIYFAGKDRITLPEVLQKLKDGILEKVSIVNYMKLLGEDDHHHDEGDGHLHGGGCGCGA